MCTVLKDITSIARKEYTCGLCGCKIEKGQRYSRQTVADDGVHETKCHTECTDLISMLHAYGFYDDDEITERDFIDLINDIIHDGHPDDEDKWENLSMYEKVKKTIVELDNELKNQKKMPEELNKEGYVAETLNLTNSMVEKNRNERHGKE